MIRGGKKENKVIRPKSRASAGRQTDEQTKIFEKTFELAEVLKTTL